MLHAPDYANMGLQQIEKKLLETKKNDAKLAKGIQ